MLLNELNGYFQVSTPSTLPSSAIVELPPIHIHADYKLYNADTSCTDADLTEGHAESHPEGLVLREGNYFNAIAEVGTFEHSLTTDLLNHLVFVQKVFMKVIKTFDTNQLCFFPNIL